MAAKPLHGILAVVAGLLGLGVYMYMSSSGMNVREDLSVTPETGTGTMSGNLGLSGPESECQVVVMLHCSCNMQV